MIEQIHRQGNTINQSIHKDIQKAISIMGAVAPTKQQSEEMHILNAIIIKKQQSLRILLQICGDNQRQQKYKKAALTMVQNYIRLQTAYGDFTKKHDRQQINNTLYNSFLNSNIDCKYKQILERSYIRFVHSDKSAKIQLTLAQNIFKFFTQLSNLHNKDSLKGMTHIVRTLLHGSVQPKIIQKLTQILKRQLNNFILKQTIKIISALKTKNQQQYIQNIQQACNALEVYKFIFIKTDVDRFRITKLGFIAQQEFSTIILTVLQLNLPDIQPSLIVQTRQLQPFKHLNTMKVYCLQMIINALNTFSRISKQKQQHWYFQTAYQQFYITLKIMFSTFPNLIAKELGQFPKHPVRDPILLNQSLKFIHLAVRIPEFYKLAQQQRELILYKICMQCLITSQTMKNKSSEDFKGCKEDIANIQSMDTIQNSAGKIIEAYVDSIDGSLLKFVDNVISLVDFQLTATPRFFEHLSPVLVESTFYNSFSFEDQIEVALLCLTIVSYKTTSRQQLPLKVEQFLIRRRQYFLRVQLNPYIKLSFFLCYTYYVDNFYKNIVEGLSQPTFHLSMLDHALILINTYKSSEDSVVRLNILQSYDVLENTISQKQFIVALFPNEESRYIFVKLFQQISNHFNESTNVLLCDILLQFFKEKFRTNMKLGGKHLIHPFITQQVVNIVAIKITEIQDKIKFNRDVVRTKLFQILGLSFNCATDPFQVYKNCRMLLVGFMNKDGHQWELLQPINFFLNFIIEQYKNKKVEKNQQNGQKLQQIKVYVEELSLAIINNLNIIQKEGKYGIMFGIVQNIILLNIAPEKLLMNLNYYLFGKNSSIESHLAMQEHTAYLILQLCDINYSSITRQYWNSVIQAILAYLERDYIRQQEHIYGKMLCILLCCFQSDFEYWNSIYSNTMQSIWKLILSNEKRYLTQTQQKICIIRLSKFVVKYPMTKEIIQEALRIAIMLTYFGHNGQQLNWWQGNQKIDDDCSLSSDDEEKQYWETQIPKINNNNYLHSLPNEVTIVKTVSVSLLQKDSIWFKQLVEKLPIAIKNFMKNNVLMYQEGVSTNTQRLRKIVKVKRNEK